HEEGFLKAKVGTAGDDRRQLSIAMAIRRSCCAQLNGAPQIEGGEDGHEVSGVSSECMTSCSRPAVEALHLAEDPFDRCPMAGDEIIAALLTRRERWLALVPALGDAILDAGLLQSRPTGLFGIGLVTVDRPFVPRDKLIGDLALIGLGAGQHRQADQTGVLVHADMGLVAEMRAAVLLCPTRSWFAWVRRARSGLDLRRIVRGRNQGRIHQRALLEDQTL